MKIILLLLQSVKIQLHQTLIIEKNCVARKRKLHITKEQLPSIKRTSPTLITTIASLMQPPLLHLYVTHLSSNSLTGQRSSNRSTERRPAQTRGEHGTFPASPLFPDGLRAPDIASQQSLQRPECLRVDASDVRHAQRHGRLRSSKRKVIMEHRHF